MHEYTPWQIKQDRMRELMREADAQRLAAKAREGRTPHDPRRTLPRWLSLGLARFLQPRARRSAAPVGMHR